MKKSIKIIVGMLIIGALFVVFAGFGSEKGNIKIGFIGSLSGVVPTYGEAMKGGVEIAVKEINANGGINGRMVEVIYEDGKCIDSKSAVSAAQKLINLDKVEAIIGGGCSNEVLASADLFNQNEVVMFSSGASSPTVSDAGEYVFRNAPNDTETGIELARRIFSDGYKTVGIISDQTEYSKGFKDPFFAEFQKLGGTIAFDATLSQNSSDLRTDLLKIKNIKTDAIFVNPNYPSLAGLIAKQAREIGIGAQFYMSYHATEEMIMASGGQAEGTIFIGWPVSDSVKAQRILADFETIYGHESTYKFFTLAAYDAMNIVADGMKEEGYTGKEIKKHIDSIDKYEGSVGEYTFSEKGDAAGFRFSYQKLVNGKFVDVE